MPELRPINASLLNSLLHAEFINQLNLIIMETFQKAKLYLIGMSGILAFLIGCEKSSLDEEPDVQQKMDLNENYFEGPVPEATVPLVDYADSGNDLFKSSHEETGGSSLTEDIEATLWPEESHTQTLTATITGGPSVGDIMFIMDLTGSMGGELSNARNNSINIMNSIRNLIPNTNFGVSSHMDYPAFYSGCGYSTYYGSSSDYPYVLDASLSSDLSLASTALNSLNLGNGSDGPENYSRPLWELTNDPDTGWRSGSKRVAIAWLDNIPHDCNVYSLIGSTRSTGPDPGRDGIANNEDDIVLVETLQQLRNNNISLITLYSGSYTSDFELWSAASRMTGGQAYQINSNGTIPGDQDIAEYLAGLIADDLNTIDRLTIEVCDSEFASWLTAVEPAAYTAITLDTPFVDDYDVTITAPAGTAPGVYEFELCLIGDGAEYARTNVVITVPETVSTVAVDIHPGSCPNPLATNRNGLIPVSISGQADFDVNDIDLNSLSLEGVSPLRSSIEDVSTPYIQDSEESDEYNCHTLMADGYDDLSLKFDNQSVIEALGPIESGNVLHLTLTGLLKDGTEFSGGDVVIIK